jgi:4-amino-4-deoxy-L-arabinose transferase-like glycosyltransferase
MQATTATRLNALVGLLQVASDHILARASRLVWVASLAPFLAYLKTAAPTVYNLDSAELSTAASTLGVPHPPGYPLYILIGKAFSLIPLGDVGYRMNLMSAVFGGLTLVAVYFIVLHLTGNRIASLVAAWVLGFSYHFWADAVVAEVYTLDAFLTAVMTLMLLRWSASGSTITFCLAFLAFGLGLATRTTILLCLPAVAIYVLLNRRSWGRRWWLAPLAALPGLALYALLPIRSATGASYMWGSSYDLSGNPIHIDLTEPSQLWWFVSARVFQPLMHIYNGGEFVDQLWTFTGWLWRGFLGIGVVLALLGVAYLVRRNKKELLLLSLIFIPQTAFYVNYAALDKETMLLPSFLMCALAAGAGAAALLALARSSLARPALYRAVALFVLTVPFLLVAANGRLVNVSEDYRAREQSVALFRAVEPDAIVVGWWTDIAPLEYLQQVEGQRPDVSLVHSWAVNGQFLIDLATANVPERAMYVMHDEPALRGRFELAPVGQWYRVEPPGGASSVDAGGRQ